MVGSNDSQFTSPDLLAMQKRCEDPLHFKVLRAKHFAPAFGGRRYFAAFATPLNLQRYPAMRRIGVGIVGHKLFALAVLVGIGVCLLVIPAFTGGLGANPLEKLLHQSGEIAIWTLGAVLALSPLRVLFPRSRVVGALNRHRRAVGVSACIYGLLHFALHILYEGGVDDLLRSLSKPFTWFGLGGLSILVTLALTSNNWSIRRLGGRKWKFLHRLAYLAAALLIYHQSIAGKGHWHIARWLFFSLLALQAARLTKVFLTRSTRASRSQLGFRAIATPP